LQSFWLKRHAVFGADVSNAAITKAGVGKFVLAKKKRVSKRVITMLLYETSMDHVYRASIVAAPRLGSPPLFSQPRLGFHARTVEDAFT
jgi:hypothetical protein